MSQRDARFYVAKLSPVKHGTPANPTKILVHIRYSLELIKPQVGHHFIFKYGIVTYVVLWQISL